MAIKKSELYSSLWKSCDQLRGGMDASQYKDYVLVLLFVKYISDKYDGVPYAPIVIPEGASFKDMVKLKGNPNIGDLINKQIIGKITEVNKLSGTIDVADFNNSEKLGSGKDMVDKLTNLIAIFEAPELDFSRNKAEGDDILGDAYEYLMKNFATESGKSKGQFYTPAEVSRIMAKIIGINNQTTTAQTTVYDPTCGSGSLLLKIGDEAGTNISLFGQEMDVATSALARMNMVLHNHGSDVQSIKQGNTLSSPHFLNETGGLKTFDFVVANPPFSYKNWTNGVDATNDTFDRFAGLGIPPDKNGDYTFLLHIIKSLKSKGKGAIILPHGVLFRGNSEGEIRKNLINRGYIKGIIGLPANLFYGTGIPACIIVVDKENSESRKSIFMIDASKGFIKDGNKNRLRDQDIHKIVDTFTKQIEIEKYSRIVPFTEIEKNEHNLNIPRYIDSQEAEDIQDIEAHLLGDIPNTDIDSLNNYWSVCPTLRKDLFTNSSRAGYSKLKISSDEVKNLIHNHREFESYNAKTIAIFNNWKSKHSTRLKELKIGDKPKEVIHEISEDLLTHFADSALLDRYDIYQYLMSYWQEIMQDDLYEIVVGGWLVGNEIYDDKKLKIKDGLIIPKKLIAKIYFSDDLKNLESIESEKDNISNEIAEIVEENSSEDGLFTELDKVNKACTQARLKTAKANKESEEISILEKYLGLLEKESDLNKKIKALQSKLEDSSLDKIKKLSEEEIKNIVVNEKWMSYILENIQGEMQKVSQRLTGRINELSDRYSRTLPELEKEVQELSTRVTLHLNKMGFKY